MKVDGKKIRVNMSNEESSEGDSDSESEGLADSLAYLAILYTYVSSRISACKNG